VPVPLGAGSRHSTAPHHGSIPAHWGDRVALGSGGRRLGDACPGPAQSWRAGRRIEWTLPTRTTAVAFSLATSAGVWPCGCRLSRIGSDLPAPLSAIPATSSATSTRIPLGRSGRWSDRAETLAGTSFEIDYVSQPQGVGWRPVNPAPTRQTCWAPPVGYGLSGSGQTHICFGLPRLGLAPNCPQ